jgi:hypothetical protein
MKKHSLDTIEPQIVQIACDGIIDESEMPIWTRVRKEMEQMASAVMSLLFIPEKKRAPLAKVAPDKNMQPQYTTQEEEAKCSAILN